MIVVTTPTGNIGSQLLAKLIRSGEPVRVIARDPSRLAADVRERVEVVQGSHGDADVVNRAFAGAESVFWLVPPDPKAQSVEDRYLNFTRPACDAFKRLGVQRVVGVTALGRGWPGDAGYVSASLAMDDLIAGTGVSYKALACPGFMDNILWQAQSIKTQGMFFGPISGDLKVPTCATRDIAAAAAKLLINDSWSGADSVPVLGPEDLSCNDQAQIMSEVLEKPVRFQEIPLESLRAQLLGRGYSEAMAQGMVAMLDAKAQGMDNIEPRTPQATTPTSFRQWCEEILKPAALSE